MEYFKKYFKDIDNWDNEEIQVICPFHNDNKPSASINTEKDLFHCFACNIGLTEQQFFAKVNNLDITDTSKLLNNNIEFQEEISISKAKLWSNEKMLEKLRDLGLTDNIIDTHNLGLRKFDDKEFLSIPIYFNQLVVDIRYYNIYKYQESPKFFNKEVKVGYIFPFENILNNNKLYLLEGEKDTLLALSLGLNAITITGGCKQLPNKEVIDYFKDKDVVVCYDNDIYGKIGTKNIYGKLKDIAKSIKYIDISKEVKEEQEDFSDYIMKYNNTLFDFLMLDELDISSLEIEENKKDLTTIKDTLKDNKLKQLITSQVLVISEYTDTFLIPTFVEFEKMQIGSKKDTMFVGDKKTWEFKDYKGYQLLELIEVLAKDNDVKNRLKSFVDIPYNETGINIKYKDLKTIYKATITDKQVDGSNISLDIYSFEKLEVGYEYLIDYYIFPHPLKNQKLVAILNKKSKTIEEDNYNLNMLKIFQKDGSIEERLDYLYKSAKSHIAKHLNFDIWLMADLVFNSVAEIEFDTLLKGYLDVFFLGDTQVGKAIPLDELVLTPKGYTEMRNIKVGDIVYGRDGNKTKVKGVYYQGVRPTYEITFSDNTKVRADKDHLWKVQDFRQRTKTKDYSVKSTYELIKDLHIFKDNRCNYSIDYVDLIKFDKKELLLDPYTVGCLVCDKSQNKHTLDLYNGLSNDKYIPSEYLLSNVEDRLRLLRGLIDTDGYVDGNRIQFSTSSKRLKEDFIFLVQSLGGSVTYRVKHPKNGKEAYEFYIHFSNSIVPFSSRKHINKYNWNSKHKNLKRYIKDIKYIGDVETQCIVVDNEEHLFVMNNMTVTHNSETTSKLVELYNFGHFLSLKTSTTTGLIGGSAKSDGGYCNTIGAIPRQHKKLVVLEEFSGAKPDFIKTMTDIRSSGIVRLTRVSGELNVNCKLRMLTISNPINDLNGNPRFLETFPNGIQPLMELITSAEDIARYDGFLLIPKVVKTFNPFTTDDDNIEAIEKKYYENKILWVYSRKKENIILTNEVKSYIWEKSQELNELYECNFPLFGVTTPKKLVKFSVALATLLVNTDETLKNIIVTKEIVDYIVELFKKIYSSKLFKLDFYTKEYRSYNNCNDEDINKLSLFYNNNATLLEFLSSVSKTTRGNLNSISGLNMEKFNNIFNKLISDKFIKLNGDYIYPTTKFRKAFNSIDKNINIESVPTYTIDSTLIGDMEV